MDAPSPSVAAPIDDETTRIAAPIDDETTRMAAPVDDETTRMAAPIDDETTRMAAPVDDETTRMAASVDDEATRKSSRLKGKPRLNVVRLLSEKLAIPRVSAKEKKKLIRMRAEAGLTADGKDAKRVALSSRRWIRPTAKIEVGSDGERREILVYPCRVCDYMGRTSQSAKKHEDKAHPSKVRCKVCQKYLHSYQDLEIHALQVHQLTPKAVKCDACEFIAPDKPTLDAHVEYEHYTGAKRNEHCRELVDGQPCKARFVQIRELRKHLSAEHGLAAAMDTIREEFATWEEFMRWKAQFELETRSVYKIGYGRRQGNRRYMCIRSGRYNPVPDEVRQRKPREHRTIKLGHNCTATIICHFPETGGVRVMVNPFHYGHQIGDVRLPGMKPEGAPDDWTRPDTRKKRKRKPNIKNEAVVYDDWMEPADDEGPPLSVIHLEYSSLAGSAEQSSQESSAAPSKTEPGAAETPPGSDQAASETAARPEGGGDGVQSTDGSGDGSGGRSSRASADPAAVQPKTEQESEFAAASSWQPYRPPRRKPGPKSKRDPPPPSPPPSPPPTKIRRGPFGRPLPAPARAGPGGRYKKLLRSAKVMKRLRIQLAAQLTRLEAAKEEAKTAGSSAATGTVGECLIGTALEDVSELDSAAPPLAVLRAEPGDLDTLPDGVFPEMELLTAPTDLDTATGTIFDLKLEVLALRARLVRRAAVETALRADALESGARQAAAERELRVELERARAGHGGEAQQLRRMMESVFSPAQLLALEDPAVAVPWAGDDYEQAIALRWLCSQEAFDFVRHVLKVPMPSMNTVQALVTDGRLPFVAQSFVELVRAKAMEGETVGEDEDSELEMRVVVEGPEETVSVGAEAELPRSAAHDHGFTPVLDLPPPPVVYRRKRRRQRAPVVGPVRNIRFRTADGGEQDVSVTVRVTEPGEEAWRQDEDGPMDEFEDEGEYIGQDEAGSRDAQELTIVTTSPKQHRVKRE